MSAEERRAAHPLIRSRPHQANDQIQLAVIGAGGMGTADAMTALLNTSYAFTDAVKGTLDYQYTNALGSNDYRYHKLGGWVSYKINDRNKVGVGSDYYRFFDDAGSAFDAYAAYGVKTSYTYTF